MDSGWPVDSKCLTKHGEGRDNTRGDMWDVKNSHILELSGYFIILNVAHLVKFRNKSWLYIVGLYLCFVGK